MARLLEVDARDAKLADFCPDILDPASEFSSVSHDILNAPSLVWRETISLLISLDSAMSWNRGSTRDPAPAWGVRVPSRPTHSIRIEGQPGMFLGWTPVKQVNWKKQSKGNSRKYWFIQTNGKSERSCVSTSHHQIWPARAGPATMDMTHDPKTEQ